MADDVIGVLDFLNVRQTYILGISMGSMIAQAIAGRYPDRVNGLVLHLGFTRISPLLKIVLNLMVILPGSKKKMEEGMNGMILSQKFPPTQESFRRQGEAGNKFDGRKYLGKILAKTLIINTTGDRLVPKKITRELVNGISNVELVFIEGDHLTFRTDTEKVIDPMFVFLNDLTGN
jgi:3-oxoadipate enol-lactonase